MVDAAKSRSDKLQFLHTANSNKVVPLLIVCGGNPNENIEYCQKSLLIKDKLFFGTLVQTRAAAEARNYIARLFLVLGGGIRAAAEASQS